MSRSVETRGIGSMESVDCIDRDKMYDQLTWRDKHKRKQTRINHWMFGAANASIITPFFLFVINIRPLKISVNDHLRNEIGEIVFRQWIQTESNDLVFK